MSNLLSVIQSISVNAVEATKPASLAFGTVTKASPLEIQINQNLLTIGGSTIILTEPVVEKKITIQKHTHKVGSTVGSHVHDAGEKLMSPVGTVTGVTGGPSAIPPSEKLDSETAVVDTVLSSVCTEFGEDLPVESDDEKIVLTINRGLDVGDKVIMLRLMGGQRFLVLSRIFKRDDEEEDE